MALVAVPRGSQPTTVPTENPWIISRKPSPGKRLRSLGSDVMVVWSSRRFQIAD